MNKVASMDSRARASWLGLFITIFMAIFILVVLTCTIVTFILPEAFASSARIKVERPVTRPPVNTSPPTAYGGNDFVATDFEVLQSEKILDRVIDILDLDAKWAQKYGSTTKLKDPESRALLRRMMELRSVRNTSIIEIKVYSDNRQEAAAIANAIAEVYISYLQNQRVLFQEGTQSEYKKLTDELKRELADKSGDPAADDAKITRTIARAGELYAEINAGHEFESAEIIERALPGMRSVRPNKPLNIALGLIMGAVAGFIIAGAVVVLGILLRKPQAAITPAASPPVMG